jgi:hypothetical protein
MKRLSVALVVVVAVALVGCGQVAVFGHTIGEPKPASLADAKPASKPESAEFQKVKAVSIVLTEQAAATVAADAKFNVDALLSAVKSELQSREALEDSNAQLNAVAEIAIDDYALHPTSNVILFGQIISTGVLNGTLRVRDDQGNELSNRRIEAQARVSIPAKGESENPLGLLYREFAVQTGNTLTGKIIKPVVDDSWRPR